MGLQCVTPWHSASIPLFLPSLNHQHPVIDIDYPNRTVMANHYTPLSTLAFLTTYMYHVVLKAFCGWGTKSNAVSADICTPVLRKCVHV